VKIGRYEVVRELGRGAMGTVFLARDTALERLVALKTFRDDPSASGIEDSIASRRRMLREAQRAGTLSHPNIVTIFDIVEGEEEGSAYIVMEYVEGRGLDDRLKSSVPLPLEETTALVSQIASALDHLHGRGIVHRDVKPANVLVARDGNVKITDFGVARSEDPSQTLDSEIYGTPQYMSPEQIRGDEVDARSDVFSLGVMLYEMLVGTKPFPGDTVADVTHRILTAPMVEPALGDKPVPAPVRELLARALVKDPDERFQSAGELAAAVRALVLDRNRLEQAPTTTLPDDAAWARRRRNARIRRALLRLVAPVALLIGAAVLFLQWQTMRIEPDAARSDAEARQTSYVMLISEGVRLLDSGDPQAAAVLFQTAEGFADDPVAARKLREDAQRQAAAKGEELRLDELREQMAAGHYDEALRVARVLLASRSGSEESLRFLEDVQRALERRSAKPAKAVDGVRPRPASARAPAATPAVARSEATPAGADVEQATLLVDLDSESECAEFVFVLYVANRQVVNRSLAFYERSALLRKVPVRGHWSTELPVEPGRQPLLVLVTCKGVPANVSRLEMEALAGGRKTLSVAVSGAGEPRVELR
jgi:tRNA A-37 threonylcarbamoyl transferase component Bud32